MLIPYLRKKSADFASIFRNRRGNPPRRRKELPSDRVQASSRFVSKLSKVPEATRTVLEHYGIKGRVEQTGLYSIYMLLNAMDFNFAKTKAGEKKLDTLIRYIETFTNGFMLDQVKKGVSPIHEYEDKLAEVFRRLLSGERTFNLKSVTVVKGIVSALKEDLGERYGNIEVVKEMIITLYKLSYPGGNFSLNGLARFVVKYKSTLKQLIKVKSGKYNRGIDTYIAELLRFDQRHNVVLTQEESKIIKKFENLYQHDIPLSKFIADWSIDEAIGLASALKMPPDEIEALSEYKTVLEQTKSTYPKIDQTQHKQLEQMFLQLQSAYADLLLDIEAASRAANDFGISFLGLLASIYDTLYKFYFPTSIMILNALVHADSASILNIEYLKALKNSDIALGSVSMKSAKSGLQIPQVDAFAIDRAFNRDMLLFSSTTALNDPQECMKIHNLMLSEYKYIMTVASLQEAPTNIVGPVQLFFLLNGITALAGIPWPYIISRDDFIDFMQQFYLKLHEAFICQMVISFRELEKAGQIENARAMLKTWLPEIEPYFDALNDVTVENVNNIFPVVNVNNSLIANPYFLAFMGGYDYEDGNFGVWLYNYGDGFDPESAEEDDAIMSVLYVLGLLRKKDWERRKAKRVIVLPPAIQMAKHLYNAQKTVAIDEIKELLGDIAYEYKYSERLIKGAKKVEAKEKSYYDYQHGTLFEYAKTAFSDIVLWLEPSFKHHDLILGIMASLDEYNFFRGISDEKERARRMNAMVRNLLRVEGKLKGTSEELEQGMVAALINFFQYSSREKTPFLRSKEKIKKVLGLTDDIAEDIEILFSSFINRPKITGKFVEKLNIARQIANDFFKEVTKEEFNYESFAELALSLIDAYNVTPEWFLTVANEHIKVANKNYMDRVKTFFNEVLSKETRRLLKWAARKFIGETREARRATRKQARDKFIIMGFEPPSDTELMAYYMWHILSSLYVMAERMKAKGANVHQIKKAIEELSQAELTYAKHKRAKAAAKKKKTAAEVKSLIGESTWMD